MRNMVIIGSGPAGLTAAVYAARANLQPLLIEGKEPGGQLTLTTLVENYPGFGEGIMGPQLMEEMRKQALRFGTEIVTSYVYAVKLKEYPFRVYFADQEVTTKTVVISTGSSAKLIGIESELQLMGHGVSTCATCDGFFYRGREIAVVGGGDSAMEEATFLTKFATTVFVIHRRDVLRASKIMQDRAFSNPKIQFIWDTVVDHVVGTKETGVTGLKLKKVKTLEASDLKVDGLFVAIGHNPNTDIFKGQIDLDSHGYIKTQPDSTRTNIPGVFACGDVQDPVFRQAVTAAGTGCMAAIEAERWLEH
ncbi:MAG: thioredoxin-disulfide reductase [Acidobacteria bacterium 13_1_20CM_2_55_15]|nr:MAG: thioredoxin-disulfide reductase [Acidobacteria bacterium 13_1_40CM_56_16]OLD21331.1 MAG: thioredoxin-disulfide reductase [Acidobacteria bacterium 13_1_40CM_3_56_11]OLD71113.1 MAG: thioredoxin-disulfide reductase [Acidobacteria bacterium 13_1_40CM_2_56_11]OLE86790.1 MAG: thioredoxin-disulfide reductase [Acidobacteria bacterium 13_1_20CM_2_55_15]PYR64655.1 MAG: thioredoxin-disulfide reductase [Acidobacteriota bacterium]